MKTFHRLVANTLIASVTNNFLWFALTFWVYLETRSVIASSVIGGTYMLLLSVSALAFGTYVDHHRRKTSMLVSNAASLVAYFLAAALYVVAPDRSLHDLGHPAFWALAALVLGGAIAGNLRSVALSTTVTLLVPEDRHDKANGLVGTVNGVAFAITSVFSGLAIGYLGMGWAIGIAVTLTLVAAADLASIHVEEDEPDRGDDESSDRRSTSAARSAPCAPCRGLLVAALLHDVQQLPRWRVHGADGPLRPHARIGGVVGADSGRGELRLHRRRRLRRQEGPGIEPDCARC